MTRLGRLKQWLLRVVGRIRRAVFGTVGDAADAHSTLPPAALSAPHVDTEVAQTEAFVTSAVGIRHAARAFDGEGGEFSVATFEHPLRRLDYKLYSPPIAATAGAAELPLVLMLHGCLQDPDDFARGTLMNEAARVRGFFALYPAQSAAANPQRCWNWFKPRHQRRGEGEPALLADLVRDVTARFPVDRRRVYVAGLSAGASMAAILGEAYPDIFAAVGVHSGVAAGVASDIASSIAAMRGGAVVDGAGSGVPTIVFQGDADRTVNAKNGDQVFRASVGAQIEAAQEEPVPSESSRQVTHRVHRNAEGAGIAELWIVHGAPHAWSGGSPAGTYTDAAGPAATTEMLRFFFEHRLREAGAG